MKHAILSLFILATIATHTLDQLPEDLFKQVTHRVVLLTDTTTIFNFTVTSKALLAQSTDWCKNEQDPYIVEKLLFAACRNNKPWTVAFVLRNKNVTSAMVGSCIHAAEMTSSKSQKILSKTFPFAIENGPNVHKRIDNTERIIRFLKNGFQITKVCDKYEHWVPALHHLINGCGPICNQDLDYGYCYAFRRFPVRLDLIEIMLKNNHNPTYKAKHFHLRDSTDTYYIAGFGRRARILSKAQYTSIITLLNQYKREPINTTDIIYPKAPRNA